MVWGGTGSSSRYVHKDLSALRDKKRIKEFGRVPSGVGEIQEFFVIAKEPRARQGKEKDPGVCGLPELSGFHLMKWFIGAGAEYRRRSQSSAGVQGGSQRSAR